MIIKMRTLSAWLRRSLVTSGLMLTLGPSHAQTSKETVPAELVLYGDTGFYPQQLTRRSGKFILLVKNRSSKTQPAFEIYREAGPHVKPLNKSNRKHASLDLLDLTPGNYILREVNGKGECRIVVNPAGK